MRIGQQAIIIYASKILGSLVGFVGFVYLSNELGASVIGRYNLVVALAGWITLFTGTSLAMSVAKRLSESDTNGSRFITTAGAIQVGLLLAFVVIIAVFDDAITGYTELEQIAPFGTLVVAFSIYQLVGGVLRGQGNVHIEGLLDPINASLGRGTQVVAVVGGLALVGLVYGHALGLILATIPGLLYVKGTLVRPTKEHAARLFSFSKYAWASGAESRGWSNIDVLSLGLFVAIPTSFIGAYGAAWNISGILSLFSTSVSSAMFPQISKASSSNETTSISSLLRDALVFNGFLMIPGLIGGLLLSERILTIYGPDFRQGAIVLAPIILGRLLYNYKHQFSNVLNATDNPDLAMQISILFLILNVGLNLLFIYTLGGVGAALATVLSSGISLVAAFVYCRKIVAFAIPYREIGKQVLAAAAMGAVVFILKGYVPLGEPIVGRIVNTAALVLVGGVVYLGLMYAMSGYIRRKVLENSPI